MAEVSRTSVMNYMTFYGAIGNGRFTSTPVKLIGFSPWI
jgi:hypothetical protein